MVFAIASKELISLNEDSVWSGGPLERMNPASLETLPKVRALLDAGNITTAGSTMLNGMAAIPTAPRMYQPLGDITFDFGHSTNVTGYERWLDTDTGTIGVDYTYGGVVYTREYIASHPAGVLGFRFSASRPKSISFSAELFRNETQGEMTRLVGEDSLNMGALIGGAGGILFNSTAKFEIKGGTIAAGNNTNIVVTKADEVIVWFASESSYRYTTPATKVAERLSAVSGKYDSFKKEAIADYQKLHRRVSLNLGTTPDSIKRLPTDVRLTTFKAGTADPELIALYFQFGRFMLIASSREGSLPANLQGIWNNLYTPPWGSKFTVNINTEMNYWPAEVTNLAETHSPLFDLMEVMRPRGEKIAKGMYNCSGWTAHHNTDLWGDAAPVDRGTGYTIWPMSAAWLSSHIFEHYRFNEDKEFLREKLPTIHGAVKFFFDYLIERNGSYVTSPSTSPENIYILPNGQKEAVTIGATMDMEILRGLFSDFIAASEILGETTDIERARTYHDKLLPLRIGQYGQIQEWMEDYQENEPGHRHVSHLWALFPGNQITPLTTPVWATAANATLQRRLANGGAGTGWSRAWTINFFARLHMGDTAWFHIEQIMRGSTLPNMFDLHPPFQADGNYGSSAGIAETLLQSHAGTVHLIPAMSSNYSTGSVTGLVARGGFVVDIEWKDLKLVKAKIFSRLGNPLNVTVADSVPFTLQSEGGTGKGAVYTVLPAA
ncbi:hypothetical protein P167DRAFT_523552 [Morchella conica CCBAS932]|uniref:Uncharacterized protein n=1 Tax=Morchella conica CCBAS932 TaxID=1392247 RepID=A0A3N4KN74_9PEZI|nr:hypothetical protein P167DRAFT_523552 [Morchella conica CCBAS932]